MLVMNLLLSFGCLAACHLSLAHPARTNSPSVHSLDANPTPAVWKRDMLRKPFSRKKKTENEIQDEALKAVLYNKDLNNKEIAFTGEHLANVHHDLLEGIAKEKIQHLDAKQTQKFAKIIQEKAYKHSMDRGMALDHLSPEYESAHWRGESEEVRRKLAKKPIENLAKTPFEKFAAKKSAEDIAKESVIREKIHEHVDLAQKHIDTYAKVSEFARQHASKLRNDAIASVKKHSERTLKKLSKIEKTTQTTKDVRNLSETHEKQKKEEEFQKAAEKAAEEARAQRKEERGSSSPLAKAKNMLGKISPLGSRRSGSKKGGDSDKEGSRDGSRDGNKSAGNSPRGSPRGPQS